MIQQPKRPMYNSKMKVSCDTCPRSLNYTGRGHSKAEAEDNAVNNAFKVGWIMVGHRVHCPACVKAGRAIPEDEG